MKFFIDSKSYFRREEKAGTFTLMIRATNQTVHLNRSSRTLFRRTDEWIDLCGFIRGLGVRAVSAERLTRDYSAVLFRLHACGIARIDDFPESYESGFRKAESRDYYRLSEFCRRACSRGFSVAASIDEGFYGFYATYDRLTRNDSFAVLSLSEGRIMACLLFSLSKRNFGGLVTNLDSAIFHEDLAEADCQHHLSEMINVAAQSAHGAVTKLRYEAIHPRQDWLVKELLRTDLKSRLRCRVKFPPGRI